MGSSRSNDKAGTNIKQLKQEGGKDKESRSPAYRGYIELNPFVEVIA